MPELSHIRKHDIARPPPIRGGVTRAGRMPRINLDKEGNRRNHEANQPI